MNHKSFHLLIFLFQTAPPPLHFWFVLILKEKKKSLFVNSFYARVILSPPKIAIEYVIPFLSFFFFYIYIFQIFLLLKTDDKNLVSWKKNALRKHTDYDYIFVIYL